MKNLKLKRQKYALSCVSDKDKDKDKKYKTNIENFGMLVYKNSLISALAKNKEEKIYKDIEGWLKIYPLFKTKFENSEDALKCLVELSSTELMVITEEVLLLADAIKAFAKAEIKD